MTFTLLTPGISLAESSNTTQSSKLHQSLNDSSKIVESKVSKTLLSSFKEDEKVTFLIKFSEKADSAKVAADARASAEKANLSVQKQEHVQRSAVIAELKAVSLAAQVNVLTYLEEEQKQGNVDDFHSYHIVNGIAVTATKEVAEKIAAFAEVEKILPNETRELFTTVSTEAKAPKSETANIEWNVERVGAPAVWNMGIDGTGIVVASIDTGVQFDHPALAAKYRGYDAATGEVDHTYSWFDATAGQGSPYDDQGHGTHVTGTMVGSEADGSNQVGVAPGAKFISARAFTAAGGTDADLLEAAEWILAPGGDVTKAPDVVNNSWGGGPGLDEWYRDVVITWRAAEIFPEFSAGNTTLFNPGGPGSIATPANYPESFATGATDSNDKLASFSLEGPSPYEGDIKPDISAPGVNIRSSVPGGGYEGGWNGTSMAGPAVSAVVALLKQVDSSLTVDEIEEILYATATPLTDAEYAQSPNMGYGHGLINAYDAVSSIVSGLGTLKGQVSKAGEDTEVPTFEHVAPVETYAGMNLDLVIQAADNVSVSSVVVNYENANGEAKAVTAKRVSGDYKNGEYVATIPGNDIVVDAFTYSVKVNDFGNNEVISENYVVAVAAGITVGYSTDFETAPAGWTIFGENSSWAHGIPTTGPGSAASGEYVYATNPTGNYNSNENSTLMMPPIDLPEGNSYLQFSHWYNLERNWDFGHVFISTDQENWTQLLRITDVNNGWQSAEIDLSDYAGQRVYIGFNLDTDGSVVRAGWYIDDVALSDTAQGVSKSLGLASEKGKANANLGVEKGANQALKGEKVEPAKIVPVLPIKEKGPIEGDAVSPTLLPIGAQVNVLESGRSVNTNPANGSYSFLHAAGDFTVQAEAYGFHPTTQEVTIENDASTTANFTLEEIDQYSVSGTITDEDTGEAIEGATVLLVEDANVEPVATDASGNYSLTAYEGAYTLKVLARGYHGKEVEVNLDGTDTTIDVVLEPFYTVPGGEIGYDDGTAENARAFYDAGNGWAVRMSLPEGKDSAIVTEGVFQFHDADWPVPGGTGFAVEVWDASGPDGTPGKKLAGPIDAQANRSLAEWTVVDLTEHAIQVEGDFYMTYIQTGINTNAPGLATDENGANAQRSYQVVAGAWSPSPAAEGNYMIRARVAYGVENPVITSPVEDFVTNEAALTVEGKASATTTLQLLKNGEEIGTSEVGDDGKFALPIELAEGTNELQAVTLMNGVAIGESETVTVTLDTTKPELTIDSPKNGDKLNRETVTVEGTVSDTNLEWVKVNGQKAAVTYGKYSKRIIIENGANEIKVVAQDSAGNKVNKKITVEADFEAPEIENLTPTEDKYLRAGETVKIEFDSEANLKSTFVIHMPLTNTVQDATELPIMETSVGHYVGYWTATSNAYAKGAVIEVKAVDSFGNETRAQAKGKLYINVE
ncbi:peptidase S8 [Oceanobacillus arenosus]|uniref:Peptidase S8 n=2 Tax=Oceanobacillus arenosus TaxID=1229153 RepID=A0A3D8PV38_9BACI|nr:peptidase S8 [Oceanobacillus arenosus]